MSECLLTTKSRRRSAGIIENLTAQRENVVEPLKSLNDVFEDIRFDEPDKNVALQMLLQKSPVIEKNRW